MEEKREEADKKREEEHGLGSLALYTLYIVFWNGQATAVLLVQFGPYRESETRYTIIKKLVSYHRSSLASPSTER